MLRLLIEFQELQKHTVQCTKEETVGFRERGKKGKFKKIYILLIG